MNSADSCIHNYLNGNLSDAKQQAKRLKCAALIEALTDRFGRPYKESSLIAQYLKNPSQEAFQAACDAGKDGAL